MIDYDQDRARQAVQFLVDSSYFHLHVIKLRNNASKDKPDLFHDDAEVLNELLDIGRQNPQAMENLITVAEVKRDDRNAYQRQYMAAKRQRDRKVVQLEELLAGRKLPHDTRVRVLHSQYEVWNRERDALLRQHEGIGWTERNALLKEFWARKESEIDQLTVEAAKHADNPRPRKRVVRVVKSEPTTGFGQALNNALKKS